MLAYSFKSTQPRQIGQEHGEHFRESIRAMAEIRLELMFKEPQFRSKPQVFELAAQHLPILERYDRDLYAEFIGIAEGSGLKPEQIVVLNHYTDLRDIGGCTVIFSPSETGNLLGQTWDIDRSALDHVVLLQFQDSLVFSIAGCLGLTGFNTQGVGICINNLSSIDARVGLIWPALVRRVLKASNAHEGHDLILSAPLGSGHHYAVADKKDFFGIETTGTLKKLVHKGEAGAYCHTNHCLDSELAKHSTVRPGSTTYSRYEEASKGLSKQTPRNLDELWELLARVSLDPREFQVATCGAMAMNLETGDWKACRGPVKC